MILALLFASTCLADALTRQLLALPCEEAFEHYKVSFGRGYPTDAAQAEARGHFCRAHAALRTANFSQADFRFHNDTDKPLPYRPPLDTEGVNGELAQSTGPSERRYGDTRDGVPHPICAWWNDGGPSPLGNMTVPLPRSFDLREQGLVGYIGNQASCGNCWAFASNAVMSAAVARGTPQYRANENFSQYFGNGIVKSYLSVEFLSIRTKRYCVGSTFATAIYTLETGEMPTVELESDFPFTFGGGDPPHNYPGPKIPESAWLVPFQFVWREDAKCYRAGVDLGWNSSNPEQAAEGIYRLKSHLARGVATITYVAIYTSPDSAHLLGSYHSGYLDIPCVNPSIDHAIAFVGYGTVNGTEVWILRNSWGGWWGISGYVYFKIGSDSICCERNPRTAIPKYMEFNETTVYEPSNYTDYTVAKTFVRGKNGLEMDCDAGFYPGIAECLSCARHTPHCGTCTKTECTQCAAGYHFTDGDRPTCASCAARNCVECNPSYCCSCVEGFHLANGVCVGDA